MTDYLTALTSPGHLATKRHTLINNAWQTEGFAGGFLYEWAQCPVHDLESPSTALAHIEQQPEWFVIRGEPIAKRGQVRRTYKPPEPHFKEVDRQWLCIDIDGMPADSLEEVINQLPEYFHGVACHYQYSSSYGVKPGAMRVHLWYWLDRPVCSYSLRTWAKQIPHVDAMLYNPVQPHYTASPIFVGGEDPVASRSGLLPGRPVLTLPDTVTALFTHRAQQAEKKERAQLQREEAARRAVYNTQADSARGRYALRALASACDRIRTAGEGDRHLTIYQQAADIAELLDYLDEAHAVGELRAVAFAAYAGEGREDEAIRTIEQAFEAGRGKRRSLEHIGDCDGAGWWECFQPSQETDDYERQEREAIQWESRRGLVRLSLPSPRATPYPYTIDTTEPPTIYLDRDDEETRDIIREVVRIIPDARAVLVNQLPSVDVAVEFP
jgi:tetratricopeptide (TPR) repeat protein